MQYKTIKGSIYIDDQDVKLLHGKQPTVDKEGYPTIGIWNSQTKTTHTHRIHKLIMTPPKGKYVDHINGNKLDNRRSNLRICTNQLNSLNRSGLNKNNKSGCRGVYWDKTTKSWSAQIKIDYKTRRIGRYKTFEDAVNAQRIELEKVITSMV